MNRINLLGLTALGLLACGERGEFWESYGQEPRAYGLENGVVVLDTGADRALVVQKHGDRLSRRSVPIGHNVVAVAESSSGRQLGLLATGDLDEVAEPEGPSLTILDSAVGRELSVRSFPLLSPRSGLVLDPAGEFAIVHATANSSGRQLTENPNELTLIDLTSGQTSTRSLRSYGGRPARFTFTPKLGLPGGERRLLVVQTEQDLALIDLQHLDRPEITVRLTSGQDARVIRPAAIAIDDGDASRDDDTRIAVRADNASDIITLTLQPDTAAPMQFTPVINLADAGGVVSDLAFVRTEGGLRIAALVPSRTKALLLEPDTSRVVDVPLGGGFSRLSLTGGAEGTVFAAEAGDLALLYGEGASSVAFWAFRGASERPYRTVEVLPLGSPVHQLLPVADLPQRRVVAGPGSLYVIDLNDRSASPLSTPYEAQLHLGREGGQFWVYSRGAYELSQVRTTDLALRQVRLGRPIGSVFDVRTEGGGRALFVFDGSGTGSLTALDAQDPDPARQLHAAGLLLRDAP